MPGPAFLRGDRISLHPIEEDDLDFLQTYRNMKEVRRPLTDTYPRNDHQMQQQFEESGDGDGVRLLICVGDDDGVKTGDDDAVKTGDDDAVKTGDDDAVKTGDEEGLTRVGEIGIPWVRQPHASGMLMYWVAPDHQGQGYVTEATELLLDHAFNDMRLNKVWAMVIDPNEASQHVLEKVGFEREGIARQGTFIDGEYVDNHNFGILAEDWLDGDD